MFRFRILAAALVTALSLAGCDQPRPTAAAPRPVRTVAVERRAAGETVTLTGQVRAKDQVSVAFRLDGRILERPVNVGDVLTAGQIIARLDPQDEQNALRSAQANLAAAEAQLRQARLTFGRQQELLKDGWTPRAKFDEAQQGLSTAQAQVEAAQAQLHTARDQLSYTTLTANSPSAVTAVGAESGEVVRTGQMVVQLAVQGPRDAVFDVPEQLVRTAPHDPVVEIVLNDDRRVTATGRVREVAPQADSQTRTFQVKVGIIDPPAAMRLGSTVTGRITLALPPGMEVPASALTESAGQPAVWVVDAKNHTVSLRTIEVAHYEQTSVLISDGLEDGELVVTAGVQTLHPGQQVQIQGGV